MKCILTENRIIETLNSWKGKRINVFINTSYMRISINMELDKYSLVKGTQVYSRDASHYITTNMIHLTSPKAHGLDEYTIPMLEYIDSNVIEKENSIEFLYRDDSNASISLLK